jgi:hypothetical protein
MKRAARLDRWASNGVALPTQTTTTRAARFPVQAAARGESGAAPACTSQRLPGRRTAQWGFTLAADDLPRNVTGKVAKAELRAAHGG